MRSGHDAITTISKRGYGIETRITYDHVNSQTKTMREIIQYVWIGEEDLDCVFGNVSEHGALVYQWDEDPDDTGDPYVYAELYEFMDMRTEVYYLDEKGEEIGAIRAIIPIGEVLENGTRRYFVPPKELESDVPDSMDPKSRYIRRKYLELMNIEPI